MSRPSTLWSQLPPPARAVAVAASEAVTAVQAGDADRLADATATLAVTDGGGLILGTVVRLLLEERYPDGLDGDDVSLVLTACVTEHPTADPHVLLVLLAGALGVHPEEDGTQPSAGETAAHGPLLVAYLLDGSPRPLPAYLTAAFTEIARTEEYD